MAIGSVTAQQVVEISLYGAPYQTPGLDHSGSFTGGGDIQYGYKVACCLRLPPDPQSAATKQLKLTKLGHVHMAELVRLWHAVESPQLLF